VRAKLLTAVLATALLATGCATVPTQGPIRNSSQDGAAPALGGVGVEARPPRDNANSLQVVNGFLEAMSDSAAFDVARQYLAPGAAASWDPESKISVYDQSTATTVTKLAEHRIQLLAPLIGTIDRRGSWTPAGSDAKVHFVFELVQVSNQWRVAKAPQGAYLGSNQLDLRLAPRSLYFLNPSKHMLVPDPVFLPINLTPGQAATQLVQELLKGPTSRLGNGVVSAAPPGTTVNVSVPVELGVATVALSDSAGSLVEQDRQRLAAQIAWTLRPITDKVRITVGGAPLLPDEPDILSPRTNFGQYDPDGQDGRMKDLYGLRKGKIQRIQGQDGAQDIAAKPLIDSGLYSQYSAKSFAVNLRGDQGAVVTTTRGGKPIVAYGLLDSTNNKTDDIKTIPVEDEVRRPSYDSDDNLWILDRADEPTPRLRVRSSDGKLTDVRADFGGDTPLSLRMAPDGVRALLVMRKKGGGNYVQTATVQTNNGKLVLTQFRKLELPLSDITDAAWNTVGIMVAGKSGKGERARPWQVNVDGSQPRLIPGADSDFDAIKVASNPNLDTLPVVQDAKGQLHWQGKDLGWVDMTGDAQDVPIDPVYPG
jgi:hypothetical protein